MIMIRYNVNNYNRNVNANDNIYDSQNFNNDYDHGQ